MSVAETDLLDRRAALARARMRQAYARSKDAVSDAAKPDALVRAHPLATMSGTFAGAMLVGITCTRSRRTGTSKLASHPMLASIRAAAVLAVSSARSFVLHHIVDAWHDAAPSTPKRQRRTPFE